MPEFDQAARYRAAMALDVKIAGGTIVDGSGAPAYTADLGVRDGRIVEIGAIATAAKRTIQADGALVTPGFIDMHTHYDAQALWDSELISSARNGVTTAVMGNCGVGCAPYAPEMRGFVMSLLEGVEDIPGSAVDAALDWSWRGFGSYLDRVAETPHTINLGVNATHAPLRVLAMGERAFDGSAPRASDIEVMQAFLREALDAGALGFSTDRIDLHRMAGGGHVPDWNAPPDEVLALCRTLATYPGRPIQFASDYGGMVGTEADTLRELALLREVAATGAPIYTPLQQYSVEGGWRRLESELSRMRADGAQITFEVAARATAVLMGLELLVHPFSRHPSYLEIQDLPLDQRAATMRDPAFRARLFAEEPMLDPNDVMVKRRFDQMYRQADRIFVIGDRAPESEPDASTSVKAIAERDGKSLQEVFYDALLGGGGTHLLYFPSLNFNGGNLDEQHKILSLPDTVISFGDAGAHLLQICDSAYSSFSLTHWGRDRAQGIAIERLVHQLSGAQADLFALKGRGRIEAGAVADINVIDHQALAMEPPKVLHDLPGGGRRLLQCATGYIATVVGGVSVVESDAMTGALPGAVLRSR